MEGKKGRFGGKTAWVAGAETPVGSEIARELWREGASLLLSGVEKPPEGIAPGKAGGRKLVCCPHNPTTEAIAREMVGRADRLDITVCATRRIHRVSILDCTLAEFEESMEENLYTAWCALRAAAWRTGKEGEGVALIVSSIHGEKPTGSAFLYSVANGGLNMLVREAAQDLGRLNLRVNLLRAGPLEGEEQLLRSSRSGLYHGMEEKIPRGRAGTPGEVAGAALFLCSPQASYVNGAILTVDGGFTGYYVDGDSPRRWDIGFAGWGGSEDG